MNRENAVRFFKEKGNMVRIEKVSKLEKLVYPDMDRLNQILSSIYVRVDGLERKRREWKKQCGEEKAVSEANIFVRLKEPMYRHHLWQKLTSHRYRRACGAVNPPFRRIKDLRVRPMLKKFVRDPDYRSRLAGSKTGILAPLAKSREKDVKKDMISRRIGELDRELGKEKEYKEACMVLIDWSKKSRKIFFRKPGKSVY